MPERQRMTKLKALFERPNIVLAGGINPIGAKMAEALGYDAFYMSGGNTSAHQLGWPNSGTSMRDMVDNARKIVLSVQIPVFADADTGYGSAAHRPWMRSVPGRLGVPGALPAMAAFWTSRVCAPVEMYLPTEAGRRCPRLSQGHTSAVWCAAHASAMASSVVDAAAGGWQEAWELV